MPPAAVRRPVTITTWVVMSILCLLLSPLLLAIAALAGAVLRRRQPMLLARFMIAYCALELRILAACAVLWVGSGFGVRIRSPRFRALHYRLLRVFVCSLAARLRSVLEIDVRSLPDDRARRALGADGPLLFFSRHAGPGDTLLLVDLLLRHDRQPSVVFKDTLAIDPCVDLIGHRLPHAILDTSDREGSEARIGEVAANLAPRGILLLFPEGGNLTAERRRRALHRLWRKGRQRDAQRASEMSNVMPPQPTGALAAMNGRPGADVIFSAHTGLGLAAFPRELWHHTPIGETLRTRMWLAAANERPVDRDAQIQWLYGWWERIDRWVREQGEQSPEASGAEAACD
jgi:1-acyl-sn-glycerol-3-phosphate acyltransferase